MVYGCLYLGNARNELFEIIGAWAAFIPGAFADELAYPRKVQFFSHPEGSKTYLCNPFFFFFRRQQENASSCQRERLFFKRLPLPTHMHDCFNKYFASNFKFMSALVPRNIILIGRTYISYMYVYVSICICRYKKNNQTVYNQSLLHNDY